MPDRSRPIVVKIGSNSLVDAQGRPDPALVDGYARQLAALVAGGRKVALVTSGAVATGVDRLKLPQRPAGLPERQALAAIGQIGLVHRWEAALAAHGVPCGQLLLTYDDFTHRGRYLNLQATVQALFAWGAIPVVNENDPVAVEELTVGDNDRLSALVAIQLGAEKLLLLTDIDGVYDADPRTNPDATLLADIPAVTPKVLAAAGGAGARGRGGMRSKIEAARLAGASGVTTHIVNAREPRVVERVVAGERIGTRIAARTGAVDAKRRWLAAARKIRGKVFLDAGAAKAVAERGSSLLPAGVARVEGRFERGDTIALLDPDGTEIARGLAGLSAQEMDIAKGRRLDAAATALGYPLPKAAVHRDHLLVL